MKKIIKKIICITGILLPVALQAQAPEGISYQGVARDNSGNTLNSKTIAIKASILEDSATTQIVVYSETQTATTNTFGLFTMKIGGGTVVSGTFSSIKWGSANHYIKIEMDAAGGSNYTLMGTSQLLSVPYALYAKRAGEFGTGTLTYPTTPLVGLVGKGVTSDFRIDIQDGNGRVNQYWNAYVDSAYKSRYIVSNEGASRIIMHVNTLGGTVGFLGAAPDTAGKLIPWVQTGTLNSKDQVWFSPRGTSSDFFIDSLGNVGMGCSAPQYKLHVVGDIASSATIRGVNAYVTVAITACSDVRFKKEFTPINNPLQRVLQMQGFNYYWKTNEFPDKSFNNEKQIGFKAQDLQKILPEVVVTDKDGYLSVDYSKLTPMLVEAIKELKKENDSLKASSELRIAKLEVAMQKLTQSANTEETRK